MWENCKYWYWIVRMVWEWEFWSLCVAMATTTTPASTLEYLCGKLQRYYFYSHLTVQGVKQLCSVTTLWHIRGAPLFHSLQVYRRRIGILTPSDLKLISPSVLSSSVEKWDGMKGRQPLRWEAHEEKKIPLSSSDLCALKINAFTNVY